MWVICRSSKTFAAVSPCPTVQFTGYVRSLQLCSRHNDIRALYRRVSRCYYHTQALIALNVAPSMSDCLSISLFCKLWLLSLTFESHHITYAQLKACRMCIHKIFVSQLSFHIFPYHCFPSSFPPSLWMIGPWSCNIVAIPFLAYFRSIFVRDPDTSVTANALILSFFLFYFLTAICTFANLKLTQCAEWSQFAIQHVL